MAKDIEFESPERIKEFQEKLLRKHLVYLSENSPYYRRLFDSYGIRIDKIRHHYSPKSGAKAKSVASVPGAAMR